MLTKQALVHFFLIRPPTRPIMPGSRHRTTLVAALLLVPIVAGGFLLQEPPVRYSQSVVAAAERWDYRR